jgi:hypothetical protein
VQAKIASRSVAAFSFVLPAALLIAAPVAGPGCSASNSATVDVTQGTGGSVATGAGGTTPTGADASSGGEQLCGNVALDATRTVAAGTTLTICAGSTLTAASGVSLKVAGTLLVQGTAQSPVKLTGTTGSPGDWTGLVIQAGGQLTATYLEIHAATTGMAALAGAMFNIDHLLIDTSEGMLVLSSSGTIDHGTMRGLGDNQSSTPIYVSNASPRLSNTSVTEGLFLGVDMIVVGGVSSAPVFDHLEVADSHCAFHFDAGTGATISNSFVHHNAYGFMVIGSQDGHVVHNNFEDNQINIGSCASGSTEVTENYFAGAPFGDGSCGGLAVTGVTPPGPYTTGVGPTP